MNRTILLLALATLLMPACRRTQSFYQEGVSLELAQYRAKHISDVHYELSFSIPANTEEDVTGKAFIHFRQMKALHGVNIDFQAGAENVHKLKVNGQDTDLNFMNGHILVPSNHVIPGNNTIEIDFTASNQALNRSKDFMYTLFVPDRASTAFPCFDQPDIKATFDLSLEIPPAWTALSNGPLVSEESAEEKKILHFSMQKPISTYLFAFTAGEFKSVSKTHEGRSITMLHRETDSNKLSLNSDRIFRHHFESLEWLENYTAIPYPYQKFDFVVLPGFQYSGMEHPGAIWYRNERLFLDEDAPLTQQLRKASLIAHETAHMWFGNLVTMKWFDDVWLKEVFAGFMADKMIEPQFPEINHNLQFLLSHFPRAYSIDRSPGAHPIKQDLSNMKMAGSLYGPIIYNKAPIVFKQLEKIMQPVFFQAAVGEYLQKFTHANADWDDLVEIFDKHSETNISGWSQAWVYGKGMPEIAVSLEAHELSGDNTLRIKMTNEPALQPFPAQMLGTVLLYPSGTKTGEIWFAAPELLMPAESGEQPPLLVVLNGTGEGYGYFIPEPGDQDFISHKLDMLEDETLRAAVFLNLYEHFLNGGIRHEDYASLLYQALHSEINPQLINYLISNIVTLIKNFSDPVNDTALIADMEKLLWDKLQEVATESKQVLLDTWLTVAVSNKSAEKMLALYNNKTRIPDFRISDQVMTQLACEIALRSENGNEILEKELQRIENPDRRRRLSFIMPALSGEQAVRDAFFESLKKPENRNPEPWVLEALNYLHHPLRGGASVKYIAESLEMLEEIQRTGDIFFPKNWLDATLGNYSGEELAFIVNRYLESNPGLTENIRLKVLQSADLLFRSAGI